MATSGFTFSILTVGAYQGLWAGFVLVTAFHMRFQISSPVILSGSTPSRLFLNTYSYFPSDDPGRVYSPSYSLISFSLDESLLPHSGSGPIASVEPCEIVV